MLMSMQRAFSSRIEYPMDLYIVSAGKYNEFNEWVEGRVTNRPIKGVITTGNKFSQFDEGIGLDSSDGGYRYSNYRQLYVLAKYGVKKTDRILFSNTYYTVIQESDESIWGYKSFIVEKSDELPTP